MNSDFFGNFDEEPQIDLTPLIDCLFMLIIFFVLTMSFSKPVGSAPKQRRLKVFPRPSTPHPSARSTSTWTARRPLQSSSR